MVCKRDGITARNETASPRRFLPHSSSFLLPPSFLLSFFPSFLPSFFSHYIYVTISGSSIGLPRMSELSKEKQTVYLRRSSLMQWHRLPEHATIAKGEEAVHYKNSHV